jgi:hypothetical protein
VTKLTIHSTGTGECSLTQREGDGLIVTFDDGTVRESFLSWKAFRQLLGMKVTQRTAFGKGSSYAEGTSRTSTETHSIGVSEGKSVAAPAGGNGPAK